ncbi:MAG: YebC/PmpR family DNA-binding transcriptional regulator [Planctomycetota bacterium]
MAGHSHWAGIKHKKAVVDARRGKLFSKLSKGIMSAARQGGGDPETNLKLKYAIDKAKAGNMTRDAIERAVKKGTGELGAENFEELSYEGYAPGGIAIMVEALTDNRNRTAPEIKKLLERRGGQLGAPGCVAYLFTKQAIFHVPQSAMGEDELMEIVLEAGADNLESMGDIFVISGEPSDFNAIQDALSQREIPLELAEIQQVPATTVEVADPEMAKKILKLMEELDDHDDVQNVSSNFDIPEAILETLED